jgi:hypothetical protein
VAGRWSNGRARHAALASALSLIMLGLLACCGGFAVGASQEGWVPVEEGSNGPYRWWVEISRSAETGSTALDQPCLLVGNLMHAGRFSLHRSVYRTCTRGSVHLSPGGPPLVATAQQPSNGARVKMTTVAMVFSPPVRRVRAQLATGLKAAIPLTRLSARTAHAAGLARLRYAAFAVPGTWCAKSLIAQSATGETLWEGGPIGAGCPTADG